MSKLNLPVRIEEVSTMGRITIDTAQKDLKELVTLSPKFTDVFIKDSFAKLDRVDLIINPRLLVAEQTEITKRIGTNLGLLLHPLDKVSYYLGEAKGLVISISKFGLSEVRKARNSGDLEKLDNALKDMLVALNAKGNLPGLTAAGYSTTLDSLLRDLRKQLSDDNAAQVAKMKEIRDLRTANAPIIQDFWDTLKSIWHAGVALYKKPNPENAKFYTQSFLVKKMRNDAAKGGLFGKITLKGVAMKGFRLEVKPILKGRKRVAMALADGSYELTGLAGNDYIYTLLLNGKEVKSDTFHLETSQRLTLDIDVTPVATS